MVWSLSVAAGDAVIEQYAGYGPFVASFLANVLATFGDKGQLVVFLLASQYDAKKVFVGAMGAFTLWSAVEVALGQLIFETFPAGAITTATGLLFLAFGGWTLYSTAQRFRARRYGSRAPTAITDGLAVGISGRLLPGWVLDAVGNRGGLLASFLFILFAEFGDKTQLLTINLAATFPDSPLAVFAGVVLALAVRTGIDAWIGERFERWVPTRWVELVASVVFLTFGLVVLGVLPDAVLVWLLGALVVLVVGYVVRTLA